ncbi:DUF6286 domain-containing protein [Streptomyces varsoviensis]|uniref:DUF6286 domain-containing protein n=1 Tax=Streptomyces varsoviensis TaxID=67373 RepID=UPI0004CAAACE|nr:DUF6286 domain-containing protein [Streptomyces varsoviensis]
MSDIEPGTRSAPTLEKTSGTGAGTGAGAAGAGRDAAAPEPDGGRAGRFWSTRRAPAIVVALVLLGAAGLFLYDVAAVRADRPAMRWRRWLADQLATRHLEHGWVIAGAAIAVVLGLWLLVLALTPGLRGSLPMRRSGDVRAGLDRPAAALVLRDRAMEVAGVQSVRVDVKRRRVKARAQSHFRDVEAVRGDLDAALSDGIRELGLVRQPGLSVHVRRPSKR